LLPELQRRCALGGPTSVRQHRALLSQPSSEGMCWHGGTRRGRPQTALGRVFLGSTRQTVTSSRAECETETQHRSFSVPGLETILLMGDKPWIYLHCIRSTCEKARFKPQTAPVDTTKSLKPRQKYFLVQDLRSILLGRVCVSLFYLLRYDLSAGAADCTS